MTPQDTIIHLRTMRDELVAQVNLTFNERLETTRLRLDALNTALTMIELGNWIPFAEIASPDLSKHIATVIIR